ncbi:MAG: peptidyl-prolyl cis-trans isomerase [Sedimentisphaerales bacterium]|nr:peptidyl-prolyl cis-trans isomerase [Sedimentisphaerales bacterium]
MAGRIEMREKKISAGPMTAVLYLLAAFSTVGCGDKSSALTDAELERIAVTEKIQLVEKTGGLVLVVGGETITSNEVIGASADQFEEGKTVAELLKPMAQNTTAEEFKEQASIPIKDIVTGKISRILLYQHAKRELGEGAKEGLDKMAEKELRKFVLQYGGDEAKADQALAEKGMSREAFKEEHKKAIITQSYLASKLSYKRPVTFSELTEYYKEHKDKLFYNESLLKFRLIDIDISKIEITDLEENRAEKARKKGRELAARAKAGEDFARLAEEYSDGHRKSFGGLWPEVQPDSLAMPYIVLAEAAEGMNPGEIAGPLETVGHIFIMKLEAKQPAGYQPLDEVQGEVNNKILVERRNEAIIRLNAKLLREAEIGNTDEFVDFCVDKIYKMSTGPAKTDQESK